MGIRHREDCLLVCHVCRALQDAVYIESNLYGTVVRHVCGINCGGAVACICCHSDSAALILPEGAKQVIYRGKLAVQPIQTGL